MTFVLLEYLTKDRFLASVINLTCICEEHSLAPADTDILLPSLFHLCDVIVEHLVLEGGHYEVLTTHVALADRVVLVRAHRLDPALALKELSRELDEEQDSHLNYIRWHILELFFAQAQSYLGGIQCILIELVYLDVRVVVQGVGVDLTKQLGVHFISKLAQLREVFLHHRVCHRGQKLIVSLFNDA